MTIEEWHRCADPFAMLDFLFPMHGSGSTKEQPRKLRLYFCALARIAWPYLPTPMRATVLAAERLADSDSKTWQQFAPIVAICQRRQQFDGNPDDLAEWERELSVLGFTSCAPEQKRNWTAIQSQHLALLVGLPLEPMIPNFRWVPRPMHRADLIREIIKYPHYQIPFEPSWRTAAVVNLAEGMYGSRDFSPMPLLADALMDAGCEQEEILAHCRDRSANHVRGCWVADRIVAHDQASLSRFTEGFE